MRNMMRWMALLSLIMGMGTTGCTESVDLNSGDVGGWIDSDAQLDDPDVTGAADTTTASDSTGADDSDAGDRDDLFDVGVADIAAPDPSDTSSGTDTDLPSPDVSRSDVSFPVDAATDGACQTNSECGQGEVCCPQGLQGELSCQAAESCQIGGGTCETSDECADGEGCCEFGGQLPNICSTFCDDSGGTPGDGGSCQDDSDCAGADLCCPGLLGNRCADECRGGGGGPATCSADSDCSTGDICCTLLGRSLCISESLPIPCE